MSNDKVIEIGDSSSFLRNFYENLKKGKVLDVVCGFGVNSIFLAEKGFQIEAIDYRGEVIQKAKDLALSKSFNIDFKQQSLDFYLSPIQKYDSTIIIDYKCSFRLLDEFKKGLVVGGTLLLEAYTTDYIKYNFDTTLSVNNCYKPYELSKMLKGWDILYYNELNIDQCYKVRTILKKTAY